MEEKYRLYAGPEMTSAEVDDAADLIPIRDASETGNARHKKISRGQLLAGVQAQLDSLSHVPIDITSFTNTVGTVEIGSTVTSVTFNWVINKTPATLSINQGIGSITPTLNTATRAVNVSTATTYTLTASDGTSYPGNTDTATTAISFQHKVYWGISASTSLDSSQIIALNSSFGTTRVKSFTINGDGQYIYYAYPASFGNATFTVNGLVNSAWTKTTLSFTNASGNITLFNIYRTNTVQNGDNIQISVS